MVSLELLKDLGSLALVSGDDTGELFEQRQAHPVSSSLELLLGGDGTNRLIGRSEADYLA
jgi:hypothetical protein